MGSETTAAATGQVGVVRRDPMAMLPFCGYNMADYWRHYLNMGSRMSRPPKIFGVNWFRVDDRGKFIWPGFGDNIRVLKWVIDRVTGAVPARETPAGLVPRVGDLDMTGLDLAKDKLERLFEVKIKEWRTEVDEVRSFLKPYKGRLPAEIREQYEKLERQVRSA
jgi:phosphoenolpyruvate carboxykinase (GTP)